MEQDSGTQGTLAAEADVYLGAARWAADVVRGIRDEEWSGPGLGGWDLRALVGHTSRAVRTVEQYIDVPAETEDLRSPEEYFEATLTAAGADPDAILSRGIAAGAALGDDPAAAFGDLVERVAALLADRDDSLLSVFGMGIRLSTYLPTRTFELTVHGLDILRATGRTPDRAAHPPAAALAGSLRIATTLAARAGSGADVLLALTGRTSLPPDYTALPGS